MIHWRSTIEETIRAGKAPAMVIADLDMKNFFNSIEWKAIRESATKHLPDIMPTINWEQQEEGLTFLGDGTAFRFNRGAEQGETLGPIKSVLPLLEAREAAWFSPGGDRANPSTAGPLREGESRGRAREMAQPRDETYQAVRKGNPLNRTGTIEMRARPTKAANGPWPGARSLGPIVKRPLAASDPQTDGLLPK